MGYGHPVWEAYMGMSEGEPQPITQMNVGGDWERRFWGVKEGVVERVRMYS